MDEPTHACPQVPATAAAAPADWPAGKVGFVALVGRPNVGKSTFLNTALDYRLAAVSPKPQTTRRRWLGIRSDADSQMLFLDTPGVHAPSHALGEAMVEGARTALRDADVVIGLADPTRRPGAEDRLVAELLAACRRPLLLALNKTDIATPEDMARTEAFFREYLPDVPCFRIAAIHKSTLDPLLERVKDLLPGGPFLFPPDAVTDAMERQIGAELIREAVLEHLQHEVPHATAVTIEAWEELPKKRRIAAVLHVERESQKAIVIGRDGSMLSQIRRSAVPKLVELCGIRIELRLRVKVSEDWRRHRGQAREFVGIEVGGRARDRR